MSEMAQTADHVIVLGRGRVVADAPISDFVGNGTARVTVRSPQAAELASLVMTGRTDIDLQPLDRGDGEGFSAAGLTAAEIGQIAASNSIVLHELTPVTGSLEDAYLQLTRDELEYAAG